MKKLLSEEMMVLGKTLWQQGATNEVMQMCPWTLEWQEPKMQRSTWYLEDRANSA